MLLHRGRLVLHGETDTIRLVLRDVTLIDGTGAEERNVIEPVERFRVATRAAGLELVGHAQSLRAEEVLRARQRTMEHVLLSFLIGRDPGEAAERGPPDRRTADLWWRPGSANGNPSTFDQSGLHRPAHRADLRTFERPSYLAPRSKSPSEFRIRPRRPAGLMVH